MRFSLRIFLGSIALIAVAIALVAVPSESQRKTVSRLKDRRVLISFDDESMPLETSNAGFINSSDSRGWHYWHAATSVWFSNSIYDHELKAELQNLSQLKYVLVSDCETEADAQQIATDFPNTTVFDTNAMREELEGGGSSKRVEKRRQTTQ